MDTNPTPPAERLSSRSPGHPKNDSAPSVDVTASAALRIRPTPGGYTGGGSTRRSEPGARLTWKAVLVYLSLYVLLDWLSYIHPVYPLAITPWNPPPALSLVLLLRYGLSAWPALFLAVFAAEAIVRDIPLSPLYAAISSLWLAGGYVLTAWLLVVRMRFDARFGRLQDVFVFLAATFPLTLVIGVGYVSVYVYAGLVSDDVFIESVLRFWIGDLIGVTVAAPLLLVHWGRLGSLANGLRRPEYWLQAAAILLTLWLIFGVEATDEFKFFYLLFLPLSWIAIRHGVEGATMANLAIQLGLIGALQWGGHHTATVLEFQFLMLALAVTGLFLGMAITERSRALIALAEREVTLGQALRVAAVGEMTSALAHELNQPLMAVSNYARASQHLAADLPGDLPGARRLGETLEKLVGEVTHAGDVVHRLREYYRYGGLRREGVATREFFNGFFEPMARQAQRQAIAMSLKIEEAPRGFSADPVQLSIVLHNLVANAIESLTNSDSRVREVTLHVAQGDRFTLRVCVEDTGPGVEPARASELFSPLVSDKSGGMGLGLSICRSLVEGHGGQLWHEARPGGGARFCFTLPIAEEDLGSDGHHRGR